MSSRRDVLRTLAFSAGALALGRASAADAQPAAAAVPSAAPAPSGPFTLPPLPYAVDALEPHLDAQTMTIHHDKHHAAYVNNLNKALVGQPELGKMPVEDLVRKLDSLPADVRTAARNQGGGHANHSQLWLSLKRDGARAPVGELGPAIDKTFGSFGAFQDKFNAAATGVFGSGWAWLTWAKGGVLAIESGPNQDSPLSAGRVPLLGIDVWEHAYYLKFQNRRAEYIAEFAKVVDWDMVSSRYRDAVKA
jgi:Fe-Mn family superoxide dismutase